VDITRKHINDMIEFAKFDMEQICIPVLVGMEVTTIELCLRDDVPIPISGFPRKLMVEDPLKCALVDGSHHPQDPPPLNVFFSLQHWLFTNLFSNRNSLPRHLGAETQVLRN
jgi:hypothetical protein